MFKISKDIMKTRGGKDHMEIRNLDDEDKWKIKREA